jgi:hypothetical protein
MPSDIADPVLASLLDELTDVNERLQRYLAGGLVLTAPPSAIWPESADDPDLITVPEASDRFGADVSTVRRWCRDHSIGRLYGGRWRVSILRIQAHLSA